MAQKPIEHKLKIVTQTPIQQKLRNKTITAKKWAEMVKPGDWINRGGPGSDTTQTMEALAARFGLDAEALTGRRGVVVRFAVIAYLVAGDALDVADGDAGDVCGGLRGLAGGVADDLLPVHAGVKVKFAHVVCSPCDEVLRAATRAAR